MKVRKSASMFELRYLYRHLVLKKKGRGVRSRGGSQSLGENLAASESPLIEFGIEATEKKEGGLKEKKGFRHRRMEGPHKKKTCQAQVTHLPLSTDYRKNREGEAHGKA